MPRRMKETNSNDYRLAELIQTLPVPAASRETGRFRRSTDAPKTPHR